ncbi:MAG TPA: DUF952 domain-containing protein [Rhizomicrobium sp.]|nr:DUF952 domain-containing protein [Rhizomicrobium sp.]
MIFKIVHADDWRSAKADGVYRGSAKDIADGFLHFSTAEQLPGTLTRYYAGVRGLLLVAVDEAALGEALKYEASTGGALYPHLYGALPRSAMRWDKPLELRADGTFNLPPEIYD